MDAPTRFLWISLVKQEDDERDEKPDDDEGVGFIVKTLVSLENDIKDYE